MGKGMDRQTKGASLVLNAKINEEGKEAERATGKSRESPIKLLYKERTQEGDEICVGNSEKETGPEKGREFESRNGYEEGESSRQQGKSREDKGGKENPMDTGFTSHTPLEALYPKL